MKTITIRLTEPTIVAGAHAEPGTVHTLAEYEAVQILGAGRAVRHTSHPPPAVDESAEASAKAGEPDREAAAAPRETETAPTPRAKPTRRRA